MGYANYDKVQIFHMTCTCVTPLSTRDRLTGHVNRETRARRRTCAHMRISIYTRICIGMQRSKFQRVSWDQERSLRNIRNTARITFPTARDTFPENRITTRKIMSANVAMSFGNHPRLPCSAIKEAVTKMRPRTSYQYRSSPFQRSL